MGRGGGNMRRKGMFTQSSLLVACKRGLRESKMHYLSTLLIVPMHLLRDGTLTGCAAVFIMFCMKKEGAK